MKILQNEMIVIYDPIRDEITTYRPIEGSNQKVINTCYPLQQLKEKGFSDVGKMIGEDILISLKGTREKFLGEDVDESNLGE